MLCLMLFCILYPSSVNKLLIGYSAFGKWDCYVCQSNDSTDDLSQAFFCKLFHVCNNFTDLKCILEYNKTTFYLWKDIHIYDEGFDTRVIIFHGIKVEEPKCIAV